MHFVMWATRSLLPALFAMTAATAARAKGATLDAAIGAIAPGVKKWASVCVVTTQPEGTLSFSWQDYADSGNATDFWPASAIKLYAVVAALELLTERGFPLETSVGFEHREPDGRWVLDAARAVPEMLHAIFHESSNVDYTLLLRMVGIDRINTMFLTPERGFPHSALMRGYVLGRPYGYVREEPQRITLRAAESGKTTVLEHVWSGRSYSAERGGTVIDARTGNVTSPRELAECLRRVLFQEHLPEAERYHLTAAQLAFLQHGSGGLTGLETTAPESGPFAWKGGIDGVFPHARFFHKCGVITNYALEVAAVDDSAQTGTQFILVPVVNAGEASEPQRGQEIIRQMARVIAQWVQSESGVSRGQ